ncbi:hypothetical protein VKT23_006004 [Stygiomarasmius scandens]|uniref:Uncharacterized protein n=1 Tax=Marasmiellus scandens TaxID=2682957 RepID=A0ABR1JPM3_9AGAR
MASLERSTLQQSEAAQSSTTLMLESETDFDMFAHFELLIPNSVMSTNVFFAFITARSTEFTGAAFSNDHEEYYGEVLRWVEVYVANKRLVPGQSTAIDMDGKVEAKKNNIGSILRVARMSSKSCLIDNLPLIGGMREFLSLSAVYYLIPTHAKLTR